MDGWRERNAIEMETVLNKVVGKITKKVNRERVWMDRERLQKGVLP